MPRKSQTSELLPRQNGRRLALFNPNALVSFGKVMTLMRDRQLAATIRELDIAKKANSTRWLLALELLEEKGMAVGLDPEDLADALDITVLSARRAMNRAEYVIYDVLGLHVSFFKRGEPWRLLNHKEAALKYARTTKDLSTRYKRARLYLNVTRYNGTEQEELQVPIFKFDFSKPEALPYEAQN